MIGHRRVFEFFRVAVKGAQCIERPSDSMIMAVLLYIVLCGTVPSSKSGGDFGKPKKKENTRDKTRFECREAT